MGKCSIYFQDFPICDNISAGYLKCQLQGGTAVMHCTAPLFCDFPISVGQPWDRRGEHHGSCGAVPPLARYLGSHVQRDGSAGGPATRRALWLEAAFARAVPGTGTAPGCPVAPTARCRGTNRRNGNVPVTAALDRCWHRPTRRRRAERSPTASKRHCQPTPRFHSNQPT